uniref:Uncharacterized protein n=1 Tax=Cacopsylla melanoneura TaxID=428564 RepID=A0A8D9E889_9HEMI
MSSLEACLYLSLSFKPLEIPSLMNHFLGFFGCMRMPDALESVPLGLWGYIYQVVRLADILYRIELLGLLSPFFFFMKSSTAGTRMFLFFSSVGNFWEDYPNAATFIK